MPELQDIVGSSKANGELAGFMFKKSSAYYNFRIGGNGASEFPTELGDKEVF